MRYGVLVLVALAACGPSAMEVRRASEATYPAPPKLVLQAAMEAANDLYGLGAVDLAHFTFVTKSFLRAAPLSHRGWGAECSRGGWTIAVRTTADGRSFVTITPMAQRSLATGRGRAWRCGAAVANEAPWVDVPPDDVGLGPDLEQGREKLALAIYERASKL